MTNSFKKESLKIKKERGAFYTDLYLIEKIFETLPSFDDKDEISILEPSVGIGNFIPYILEKYKNKKIFLDVVDLDFDSIEHLKKALKSKENENLIIRYINCDFLSLNLDKKYDLIIGNPPYITLKNDLNLKKLRNLFSVKRTTNLLSFFILKSISNGTFVSFVIPKNFLLAPHYKEIRDVIKNLTISSIIDFENIGFDDVVMETINIVINTKINKNKFVEIYNFKNKSIEYKKQNYICDNEFPNWIIYRNSFFDSFLLDVEINIFDSFRDRQITNKYLNFNKNNVWVIRSRNIKRNQLVNIDNYDKYIDIKNLVNHKQITKYINDDNVYICPNLTSNIRIVKKPKNSICNGSVAILIPKINIANIDQKIQIINTDNFLKFYSIATNFQKNTLNIDKSTIYYFCIKR